MWTEPYVKKIPGFPQYSVSNDGRVFNDWTQKELHRSPIMSGDLTAGLMKLETTADGRDFNVQHRRSVKVLVANAFVNGRTKLFDTPILLDGDKSNLHAHNIRWRPRWFAWKYAHQFSQEFPEWFFEGPIVDIFHVNGLSYGTIFEAATTNGNLCIDIHRSLQNEIRVFPTGEVYAYLR